MEQSDLNKRLDVIIEKRKNCIQLTKEEEIFANESLNKLLDAKKCVCKTMSNTTGEEIRKSAASPVLRTAPSTDKATEGVPPKDRPKEGGYDSKADVAERTEVTPGSVQVAPVKADPNLTDKKEEKLPSEKTDGKPYGDKTKEEWADVDNKKFKQENYQEDRLANMTEHADYKDSIRVSSVVTKSLSNGSKMVGQVLKVYATKNGQVGLMIKWADGRFEHVNQANVELLKIGDAAKKRKLEAEAEAAKETPPAVEKGIGSIVGGIAAEAAGVGLGVAAGDALTDMRHDAKRRLKIPKAPKPERDQAGENAVVDAAIKSMGASDTEKGILAGAGKVVMEGLKHKRAALAGAGALLAGEAIVNATHKSVDEITAGDVVDALSKLSDEEFDTLAKSMDKDQLTELSAILDDMEKGWKGAGKGAKAGAKIGAVLGGLGGGAAGAIQGGMTHGVGGAVAGGVIGGATGAVTGAISNVVPGAVVGHVIEEDEKPKVKKVTGAIAPDAEKKAAPKFTPKEAPKEVPQAPQQAGPTVHVHMAAPAAPAAPAAHEAPAFHGAPAAQAPQAPQAAPTGAAPAGEALPKEAPQEFVQGVIDTLTELTDLSEEEIVQIAQESWAEIVAEEGNGAPEGEAAPADEASAENVPAEEAPAKKPPFGGKEKTMEAGNIKKEPKK